MQKIIQDDKSKFAYLKAFTEEEKKKLLSINEDDKFLFKVIDNVIDGFSKEFPMYTKNYILEVLIGNSMNIANAYKVFKNPAESQSKLLYYVYYRFIIYFS
jgi:hypothetical protein